MNYFEYIHKKLVSDNPEEKIGSGYEEIFTRQFTFFLNSDRQAAEYLVDQIISGNRSSVDEVNCEVTQGEGRADIEIVLEKGCRLIIENKIEAKLGENQLKKYIKEDDVFLTAVSMRGLKIPKNIIQEAQYLQPTIHNNLHYYWSDFYSFIEKAPAPPYSYRNLRLDFLKYMQFLSMAPSNLPEEWPKLFQNANVDKTTQEIQEDFRRRVDIALSKFKARGHKIENNAVRDKSVSPLNEHVLWKWIYIGPRQINPDEVDTDDYEWVTELRESLGVFIISRGTEGDDFKNLYKELPVQFGEQDSNTIWHRIKLSSHSSDREKIGYVTPLSPLLKNESDIIMNIEESLIPILEMILKRIDYNF